MGNTADTTTSTSTSTDPITKPLKPITIADGRKTADGEEVRSPTETWRPNFARKQSWNQQDLKRELLISELGKEGPTSEAAGYTEMSG